MINISRTHVNFEREPLIAPFGFKGGYTNEIWQVAALMANADGQTAIGLGAQSVLWSDAGVFATNPEAAGNSLMFLMTAYALRKAQAIPFATPIELLDELLPLTYAYGQKITGKTDLRLTFALNALVAVDNAAWLLYAQEKGINSFWELIPSDLQPALPQQQEKIANIPLMTYGVSIPRFVKAVEAGACLLQIKIGADPEQDGDQEKMLAWDMARLAAIHTAVKDRQTPYTESGHILYYLDANGRYQTKELLLRFLDHAAQIGALERIILLEEPFPEEYEVDVHDMPVRLVADESAHSDTDARRRIELGYKAIALKPIAKTLSMSLKVAKVAWERGVPCFCADLTVNPVMVDWNKNVAARLAPLPGMKIRVLESNGHQNYRNWETMQSYHPCYGASWLAPDAGIYHLDQDFYQQSGGIFATSKHYAALCGL